MSIYNLSRVKKWGDHVPEGMDKRRAPEWHI